MKNNVKSIILLAVMLFTFFSGDLVYARQIQGIRYGGNDIDVFNDMIIDGDYIVTVGVTSSTNIGGLTRTFKANNGFITKMDKNGKIIWQKVLDEDRYISYPSLVKADNGYIVLKSYGNQPTKASLIKYDLNGNIVWEKESNDKRQYNYIYKTSDNFYLVIGSFVDDSDNKSVQDAYPFIAKYDGDGNLIKEVKLELDDLVNNSVVKVIEDNSGNYALLISNNNGGLGTIICFDKNLQEKWKNLDIDIIQHNIFKDIIVNKDGNYVVIGYEDEAATTNGVADKEDNFGFILELSSKDGSILSTIKAQNSDGTMIYPISRFQAITTYKDYYVVIGEAGDIEVYDSLSAYKLPKKMFLFSAVDQENVKKGQLLETIDLDEAIDDRNISNRNRLVSANANEFYATFDVKGNRDYLGTKAIGGYSDAFILHVFDAFDVIKKGINKDNNQGQIVDVPDTLSKVSLIAVIAGGTLIILGVSVTLIVLNKKGKVN